MIVNELNHKTIFVLDHTSYFGIPAGVMIDLDYAKCTGASDKIAPISKSLWTCSAESSFEYSRIVWDLFPTDKLIRFVASDSTAHIVNTWDQATQNLTHVFGGMAIVGVPIESTDFNSVAFGLCAAVGAISEPTKMQLEENKEKARNDEEDSNNKVETEISNKGRIICITSARDNASLENLEEVFHSMLKQQNLLVARQHIMMNINFCELIIINLSPGNMVSMVSDRELKVISPILSTEIHSVRAPNLHSKLTQLVMKHYNLVSTTITDIPMENNNNSIAVLYDIEIFHVSNTQDIINSDKIVLPSTIKRGTEYTTVTLQWGQSFGVGEIHLQPCIAQHRATLIDLSSRPSCCFTNFFLKGASAMLKSFEQSGHNVNTHMLSGHSGEIFIHTLHFEPLISFDDIPQTCDLEQSFNYRSKDFIQHMRKHRLVPTMERARSVDLNNMVQRMMNDISYFPLFVKSTLVFNMHSYLAPIMKIISQDNVSENEILQCKDLIFAIQDAESNNEPLPMMNFKPRSEFKRKEHYSLLWAELEMILKTNCKSPEHKVVLELIRKCALGNSTSKTAVVQEPVVGPSSDRSEAITDNPFPEEISSMPVNTLSLLDFVTNINKCNCAERLHFSGYNYGQIATLYPNLNRTSPTYQNIF